LGDGFVIVGVAKLTIAPYLARYLARQINPSRENARLLAAVVCRLKATVRQFRNRTAGSLVFLCSVRTPPAGTERRNDEDRLDEARIVRVGAGFGKKIEVLRANYRSQSFARHSHDTYTLGLVSAGAGSFWCRGAERFVHEGDMVVIPPGEVHTGSVARDAGRLSYLAIYLPADLAALHAEATEDAHAGIPQIPSFVFRDIAVRNAFQLLDLATENADRVQDKPGAARNSDALRTADREAESAACFAISELITRAGAQTSYAGPASLPANVRGSRIVNIVREVLEDSFANAKATSLQSLADLTGVTPFRVIRAFRETVGMAPHQYLIQVRVERARQFLAEGANPSHAALQSGFVDQSHLTYHFKKRFGITPGSYRRCVGAG
jgi:AraC-like DNA-binding protein/mannose-6-phosphate isomerase-like protein (cupin superfamily)